MGVGDVRELGERVPADGCLCAPDGLLIPAWVGRVQGPGQFPPDSSDVQIPPSSGSPNAIAVDLQYQEQRVANTANRAGSWHVTFWLAGSAVDLAQVESVTYYLHESFHPSVVTRYQQSLFIQKFNT
jgi:hypothetical protein